MKYSFDFLLLAATAISVNSMNTKTLADLTKAFEGLDIQKKYYQGTGDRKGLNIIDILLEIAAVDPQHIVAVLQLKKFTKEEIAEMKTVMNGEFPASGIPKIIGAHLKDIVDTFYRRNEIQESLRAEGVQAGQLKTLGLSKLVTVLFNAISRGLKINN